MLDFLMNPGVITGVLVGALILVIVLTGYVKASPDTAYIISGLRKQPKVLIGKAGIKIPFLEKKDELNLQLIPIDVKTSSAVPTADYININVDAAVNVKISDNSERLGLAAQNFLNKRVDYIANVAREVLEGNMREIVGRMNLEEMVSDRQKFAELVKENAEPDLAKMGLDIVSFNVQNFVDGNGVIENLGVDNIVKIQKNAAISRAVSERDIAQAQSKAFQEANDAKIAAETIIAEKNNELAIKKAELKKTADAKQAEAEKFAAQQRADADLYARQQNAEAWKFEQEKEAQAKKAQAEALKYQMEQEASGIRTKGEAEAKAIEAKGIAEAEALDKKAEAMKKYGEAAIAEMYFNAWPKAVEAAAKPLEKIGNITMYGEGNSAKLIEDVMKTTHQVNTGMEQGLGLNLNQILGSLVGVKALEKMSNDKRED